MEGWVEERKKACNYEVRAILHAYIETVYLIPNGSRLAF